MSPKPDVSLERIPLILNAAIKVFSQKGFEATHMEDIARTCSLSVGGVYWYYKSKEEIIIAIMERLIDRDMKELRALLNAEGTVRERLETYVGLSIEGAQAYNSITYELYSLTLRNAKVRDHIRTFLKTYQEILDLFIQQGIERKEFKPVNASEAARALLALYEGALELSLLDPRQENARTALLASINLLMNGLESK